MDGSKATSQINEKEKNKLRDDQLWCSTRLNFRTTSISFMCERLKKCFKHIGPNNVYRLFTNLFFTHKNIRYLFQIVNQKLENIIPWFI